MLLYRVSIKDDKNNIYALNKNTKLTQQTTYELKRIKPEQILERIYKNSKTKTIEDNTQKPPYPHH